MVICTYFQQGRCKFGERCRYEHPGRATEGSSGNRFGVLSSDGFGGQASKANQQQADYGVNASDIKLDLTAGKGRPEWVFSAYAPVRTAPRQLFGGPQREQSMEEMRLRHYEAVAAGNMNQAIQEAQALWQESVKQMDAALNDLHGAAKYVIDGANEHPNRIDITEGKTAPGTQQQQPPSQSAFDQPPRGSLPSAWLRPGQERTAFGQPSAVGQPSAFGQPSGLGQKPAFGQPTSFGQPSTLGQGSAFGQPSTLGGGQAGFGKPAFGQTGFAQPSTNAPAFGQTSFGQPSAPGPAAPFGTPAGPSPFGQVPQNQPGPFSTQPAGQPTPSPFGQPATLQPSGPTAFGQPSAPGGLGGQPVQNVSPFGQQPQQAQKTPFGQPSVPTNPFGAPSQQPTPFGQPAAPQGVPVTNANAGPRAFMKIDNPSELNPLPDLQGETRRNPANNRIVMWKGRPVQYIGDVPCYLHPQDNKTYVRINFPDGPPDAATLRDSQGKPEEYTPEIEEMYKFYLENGYFKDGVIPPVPPKHEYISFDF
ncbi:uncharacterized protein N7459_000424 [Penicillium hispanicum]|uniref:uncharacterized protein n=1 Tax=Penicillium hispanicum TaxID=1080232 RepID=UPI0025405516|nr:uncharacterized protein N7459_000424 [Penicillium hispanicum]KAJ5594216.1 hypothetical protein N7459_000424 [Penicillium hispanicum]